MIESLGIYFSQADHWPYLLLLPLLIGFMIRTARFRRKIITDISAADSSSLFLRSSSMIAPKARRFKHGLFLGGLFFVCLAALGPQWGQKAQVVKAQGLDVCFALDLSRSMLAEDASPSRLAQAKNQLSIFLPNLGGDRAALVGFAGSGFVAAPLSSDHAAMTGFLDPMDPSFVSNQSTNLATGVDACLTALGLDTVKTRDEMSDSAAKLIVLISDGEDQFDDYNDAVKRCENLGIPVFAMAAGTAKGSTIAIRNQKGELTGYVSQNQQPVMTKLEDKALKEIVRRTGGKIFYLSTGTDAWKNFSEATSNYKRDSRDAGTRMDREERFQWPLAIGFLLLLLDFLIPEAGLVLPFSRRKRQRKIKTKLALLLLALHPAPHAQAASQPASATDTEVVVKPKAPPRIVVDNNLAAVKMSKGDLPTALKKLEEALQRDSSNPVLRFNWATAKLFSSVNKEGSVNPKIADESIKELEALAKDLSAHPNPALTDLAKATQYQLGQGFELKKDIARALESYYRTVTTGRVNDLDLKAKKNVSRLIAEQQNSGGGGGGSGEDQKQGKEGGKDDKKDEQGKDPKKPKPEKDGEDHTDVRQKPKYSGTEISEDEARQILESVTGEEREVQKRKAQGEAKARASKESKEKDAGEAHTKQW